MMMTILEQVTSLESRSLMTMYPAQSPLAGSFSSPSPSEIEKKRVPPELSVSVSDYGCCINTASSMLHYSSYSYYFFSGLLLKFA